MKKYNPLAEYLGFLMDGYIDTFFDTCEKANYPATYQSFKDALNAAYNEGRFPANVCAALDARFRMRQNNPTI